MQIREVSLAAPALLSLIERSGLSTWIRETDSLFGFYFILLFHNIGLALAVGSSVFVGLRLLGVAPELPVEPLKRFFIIMWAGAWISAVSGVFLLIAYPTKALTNPVFYIKLTLVGIGVWIMIRIEHVVFGDTDLSEAVKMAKGKSLAGWSFVVWVSAITAGRLLAYTFRYLVYGHPG